MTEKDEGTRDKPTERSVMKMSLVNETALNTTQ